MAQIQSSAYAEKSFSDRVIDGLFSGLISGVVMILSMIIGILLYNQDPAGFLANFSFGETPSPLNGLLVHLGVSGVYGAAYSIAISLLPGSLRRMIPGWLKGLVFGGVLLSIALGMLLPGLDSHLADAPLAVLVAGHVMYGLILGWRVGSH